MRFSSRLDRARQSLDKLALDSLVLINLQDIRYLSGFSGSAGLALLGVKKAYLFVDSRYIMQASQEVTGFEVIQTTSSPWDSLILLAKEARASRIGFVPSELPYEQYEKLKEGMEGAQLVSSRPLVGRLRMIKEAEEAEAIRTSAHLLSQNLEEVLSLLRPGMKEKEIAALLEYSLKMSGADRTGFETIVASGSRSAMPHAQASGRVVQSGELLKIDGGCQWQGYHSDITRTLTLDRATEEQKKIHRIVLEAHDQAIAAARPGITAGELDAVARRVIEEAGYGEHFGHGTGHGVGLSVHEEPRIGRNSPEILEEGMAFTIEPGIYVPGWGGVRIEDTILLSGRGAEAVTTTPRGITL